MTQKQTVDMDSLVGSHVLSGFESVSARYDAGDWEDSNIGRFVLDGIVYAAIEDPSDGYRSCMRELVIDDTPLLHTFPPVPVVARRVTRRDYYESDILEFIVASTGRMILSIGTENSDDYYPYFVCDFNPLAHPDNEPPTAKMESEREKAS